MSKKKNNHGGKRKGAGRPPKADEVRLIETMDAVKAPKEVWEKLADKVDEGDTQAVKCWLEYRYGKPHKTVDVTSGGNELSGFSVSIED